MGLNIESPEAQALATELAELRDVPVAQAVEDAVREELAREKKRRSRGSLAAELLEIGERCASHMEPGVSSADHATLLYDDEGLPR
jgi:antitoxin VapB